MCSYDPQKITLHRHCNFTFMFDYWVDPVVHLLLLKCSMIQRSIIRFPSHTGILATHHTVQTLQNFNITQTRCINMFMFAYLLSTLYSSVPSHLILTKRNVFVFTFLSVVGKRMDDQRPFYLFSFF